MAILERLRKKFAPALKRKSAFTKATTDKPEETSSFAKAAEGKPAKVAAKAASEVAALLLRTPHVSEKAARLSDSGTYVFNVAFGAEKVAVKRAVESLYKVKVTAVRMIRGKGKAVRRGSGERNRWKKALVTLKKGERIDIYEGV